MKESEVIKLLPVEDRAKMEKKEVPTGIPLAIFLIGLSFGLYYWFCDSIIFRYETVSPFWGFVIFLFGGIAVDIIISWIYSLFWKDYNNLIKDANQEIEELIKKGEGSPEELYRLKRELIGRKIGNETLSQEDFLWHTSIFCWGCGRKHTQPTKSYKVYRERTERWKEGAFRYSKTFSKTSYINICPECYSRLMNAEELSKKKSPWIIVTAIILGIGICTGSYFLWGGTGLGVSFAILFFGGIYILSILAALILYPFLKHGDSSTKWSFDEIPEIKYFLNRDLPHTH